MGNKLIPTDSLSGHWKPSENSIWRCLCWKCWDGKCGRICLIHPNTSPDVSPVYLFYTSSCTGDHGSEGFRYKWRRWTRVRGRMSRLSLRGRLMTYPVDKAESWRRWREATGGTVVPFNTRELWRQLISCWSLSLSPDAQPLTELHYVTKGLLIELYRQLYETTLSSG